MQKLSIILLIILVLFNSCNTAKKVTINTQNGEIGIAQLYENNNSAYTNNQKNASIIERNNIAISASEINKTAKTESLKKKKNNFAFKNNTENFVTKKQVEKQLKNTYVKREETEKFSDKLFLLLTAFTGLGFAFAFFPFHKKIKRLALYAMDNRKKGVYLIGASHILIGLAAIFLGKNLYDLGINTSDITTYTLIGLTSAGVFFYPKRKVKSGLFKITFIKQKIATILVLVCGFSLMTNVGIRTAQNANYSPATAYIYNSYKKCFSNKNETKFKNDKVSKNPDRTTGNGNGGKIAYSILLVLGALSLLYLVAIIACGLACSDLGVLAALVTIGGLALVIYILVKGMRKIWNLEANAG